MRFEATTLLETDRLFLRPFRLEDLFDFFAYACVPGVGEMAGWEHHQDIDQSRRILDMFIMEANVLAIVDKEKDKVIGSYGVHDSFLKEEEAFKHKKTAEIGYVLAKPYWGKGLMVEATKCVLNYLFNELNYDVITALHFEDNHQSRRVIEKTGFTFHSKKEIFARQLHQVFKDNRYYLEKENFVK